MEPGSKSRDKDTPKQWEREHSTVLPDPLSSRAMLLIHQLGILTFFFPHILWIPKIHSHSGFLLKHQNVAFFSISFSRKSSFCYTDHTECSKCTSTVMQGWSWLQLGHFWSFRSIWNTKHKKAPLRPPEISCVILQGSNTALPGEVPYCRNAVPLGFQPLLSITLEAVSAIKQGFLCKWQKETNKSTSRAPRLWSNEQIQE